MRAKYTEFERKILQIARRKCENIYDLGGPDFDQYVYNGNTYFSLMSLYEHLSENKIIKKFTDDMINAHFGI